MRFKPITLADKELFRPYLSGRHHDLITYNYTNFYLWRDWDPYGWTEIEGALVIKSDYHKWDAVLPPFSPQDETILLATEALIEWYKERQVPFLMTEVSEAMRSFYENYWPDRFFAQEFPPGFNYIYNREDLAQLAGQHFAAKRNHVHHFMRENPDFHLVSLTEELLKGCRELEIAWLNKHDEKNEAIFHEHKGVIDGLEHFSELDCVGACLVAQEKVVAFTIGEPLNEDTFAIHIEKADIGVRGSFQAINQFFARDFCTDYCFINRAEDMGHPGQRKAKLSYHPHHLEKKYHLRLQ